MKFIPYEVKSGFDNMIIDSNLLDLSIKEQSKEPLFRLYGWEPACISIGRNQKDDFVDYDFIKKKNIDIVRRLTGGRALLHDDEITYSFICPSGYLNNGDNVTASYKEISQILINKFAEIGILLEFGGEKKSVRNVDYCMLLSTGADLCYKGKKLIGSAQFRKEGYILQHGSILYDYNKQLLTGIFKENVDTGSITCIKEIKPDLKKSELVSLLSPS